ELWQPSWNVMTYRATPDRLVPATRTRGMPRRRRRSASPWRRKLLRLLRGWTTVVAPQGVIEPLPLGGVTVPFFFTGCALNFGVGGGHWSTGSVSTSGLAV